MNESLEQALACRHARQGNWEEFSKSVTGLIQEINRQGRYGNNGSDWFSILWYEFALNENAQALSEYSHWLLKHRGTYGHRIPALASLVHAASMQPGMQWLINREDLHDMQRLEEHFPGITAVRAMYEGMELSPGAVRDGIRKFIEGTIKAPEQIAPEHGFG